MDNNSNIRKRPKSVTVYNKLLKMIVEGNYKEGEKLPGEVQLSEIVGASRSTLRQAIDLLCEDGFVERRHGVGNFVRHYDHEDQKSLDVLGNPVEKCFEGELTKVNTLSAIVSAKEYLPYFNYIFSKPSVVIMSSERFYYHKKKLKVYVDSLISIDFLSEMNVDLNSNDEIHDFLNKTIYELANKISYEWKFTGNNEISKEINIETEDGNTVTLVEKVFDNKGEVIVFSKYLFPGKEFKIKANFYNR